MEKVAVEEKMVVVVLEERLLEAGGRVGELEVVEVVLVVEGMGEPVVVVVVKVEEVGERRSDENLGHSLHLKEKK